jgi:cytochrome c biogenesis protein CcdA
VVNNRNFWIAQMVGLAILYAIGLALIAQGQAGHILVSVCAIILGLHVLEIPWAFKVLKARDPQPLRVLLMTLLFGLLWWMPAQRGLFAVR